MRGCIFHNGCYNDRGQVESLSRIPYTVFALYYGKPERPEPWASQLQAGIIMGFFIRYQCKGRVVVGIGNNRY